MKKKGYYEYIPQIYPRRLWVMYDTCEDEIDKCFTDIKGKPLVHNSTPMKNISHEAFHVLSSINDACDLERVYHCRNEHQAYLMGWICDCINKARLGIGDFIEIKDIKD